MKNARFLLLALTVLGASCASPRRPGCNVQSDCTGGSYCAEPDQSGNRFCTFDCKVAGDCVGMAGAVCSASGRCELPCHDGGLADADAGDPPVDAAAPDAAAPDAAMIDAALVDARVIDGAMADAATDGRVIDGATSDAMADATVFMDAAVACTLVAPQTGCGGQACDLVNDVHACRPNGTQAHGQPCGVGVDCQAGATCLSDDKCHQFCTTGGAACPNSGTCSINVVGSASQVLAEACADPRPTCSVLTQDCAVGSACYIDAAFHCYTSVGTKTENAVCNAVNDCAKPLSCIDLQGGLGFRCYHPCDRMAAAGSNGCRGGQTCTNAGLGAFVGLCTPPMP